MTSHPQVSQEKENEENSYQRKEKGKIGRGAKKISTSCDDVQVHQTLVKVKLGQRTHAPRHSGTTD